MYVATCPKTDQVPKLTNTHCLIKHYAIISSFFKIRFGDSCFSLSGLGEADVRSNADACAEKVS